MSKLSTERGSELPEPELFCKHSREGFILNRITGAIFSVIKCDGPGIQKYCILYDCELWRYTAGLVQLVEPPAHNREVGGSSPSASTI